MNFSDEKETKRLLKRQPFCNVSVEKPKIKHHKKVDMLNELPFQDQLNIVKPAKAF